MRRSPNRSRAEYSNASSRKNLNNATNVSQSNSRANLAASRDISLLDGTSRKFLGSTASKEFSMLEGPSRKNPGSLASRDASIAEVYSQQELKQMKFEYKKHCNKVEIMTKKGFVEYFHLEELDGTLVAERLYACFAQTGSIDFNKFVKGTNILATGNFEDRVGFLFTMFDLKKNNFIEKSDLKKVLLSLLNAMLEVEVDKEEVYNIQEDVRQMSPQEREEAIEMILQPYGSIITYEEFIGYVSANPIIRNSLE